MVEALSGISSALAPIGVFASPLALITGYWVHKRSTRKQSDDMALATVKELRLLLDSQAEQIKALGQAAADERRVCEANISRLETEFRAANSSLVVEARHAKATLASVIMAIKYAPARAAEIILEVEAHQDAARAA